MNIYTRGQVAAAILRLHMGRNSSPYVVAILKLWRNRSRYLYTESRGLTLVLKLLEFINQSEGSIIKKELIQKLRNAGIIRSVATKQLSASASHSQLRRFLDPLQIHPLLKSKA